MTRIRYSAPIDPTDRLTTRIKSLEEQIAELQRMAGRAVPVWANYTPSDTAITVGNGTRVARWRWGVDGMVDFQWVLTLGTTSAIAANAAVGLPRAAVTVTGLEQTVSVRYLDSGTRHWVGAVQIGSGGTTAALLHSDASGSGTVTSTAPFTWTTNDKIVVTGRYQPAP